MTHIYLIRHGQSVVNVEPIIGWKIGDRGLTDLGVQQASRLHDRLYATREIQPDLLMSSTLPRAIQTAGIIAPAFKLDPSQDEAFCEMNPGEADGLTWKEFEARYGKHEFNPTKPLSPGGEDWRTFVDRVSAGFERIVNDHKGKTVVIVCHGWVIEASFVHFFDMPHTKTPSLDFQVTNTSITHWYQKERGRDMRWFLGRYNDAVHLQTAARWYVEQNVIGQDHPAIPLTEPDE